MNVSEIQLDQDRAAELLEKYREHKANANEDDLAIMKAYRAIARGDVVIQAHQSIIDAGWDMEQGRPKLAICRAHKKVCYLEQTRLWHNGCQLTFREARKLSVPDRVHNFQQIHVHQESTPDWVQSCYGKAIVPHIPLNMRPKKGLHLYHILWEADWEDVPIDPMLIRKLAGDLWLVCAAWDLTDVERAVIADRMGLH